MRSGTRVGRLTVHALGGALVVALLLAGCVFQPGRGAPTHTVKNAAEKTDGVRSVDISVNTIMYIQHTTSDFVRVTLGPGSTVGDAKPALDWILKTAWSVNDKKIDGGVFVQLDGADGKPLAWDWKNAAIQLGMPAPTEAKDTGYLYFSAEAMTKKYGPWPGKVPALPSDLFVKN